MSRLVGVGVVVFILLVLAGILVPYIYRARVQQDLVRCQDNLRQVGSFAVFHSALPNQPVPLVAASQFPPGTLINPKLPVDKRMSWYALVLGALNQGSADPKTRIRTAGSLGDLIKQIEVDKPWDAEVHQNVARYRLTVAICPSAAPAWTPDKPALGQYLGIGGIGLETPDQDFVIPGPNAGVFNYNIPAKSQTIIDGDGLSHTMSIGETNSNLGPWFQGGPSTVRALDPKDEPYTGPGRQFGGCHPGKGNYSFADGSVRIVTETINPVIFRAMMTIAGNEKLEELY
jgi:prepilin-type processing-associated H-X9-DG protein